MHPMRAGRLNPIEESWHPHPIDSLTALDLVTNSAGFMARRSRRKPLVNLAPLPMGNE
jgi:hypothetical protein